MPQRSAKLWFAVDVVAEAGSAEAAEYAFNSLDSLGNEIVGTRDSVSKIVRVTGYFDELPDMGSVETEIDLGLHLYGLPKGSVYGVEMRAIKDADWLAEWKLHWKPTHVGRFIIAPPWSEVGETDKIVIRIEPNMAFGTGTHETTKLCLEAIGSYYSSTQTFLDVGTGTGILAIAAAKSGSMPIAACDTDQLALSIARENAAANGVDKQIDFHKGSPGDETPIFDFVCANLTIDVILPLLPTLFAKTSETLVLSGILADQKDLIFAGLAQLDVTNFEIQTDGDWISAIISRD